MCMKLYHNQRQYSRSKVSIAATLTPEHGEVFGAYVEDLSMSGIFMHTDKKLAAGSKCQVSILLGHFKHELPILADAVVVRSIKGGIALRFESIRLESFGGMQGLIVDHAENTEQAEMEFSSLGGFIFNPDKILEDTPT